MFHFFQRLGCCNCCNPSTDFLEAEDRQVFVTNGQERLASKLHSDQSITRVAAMFEQAHNFSVENPTITNVGQQVNNNHHHVYTHDTFGPSSIASAPSSTKIHIKSSQGLDNLKEFVSFSALHDSSAQDPERCCHPDTRKKVLGQIRSWADDPSRQEGILWLHGPAGVGKSAIVQTIANSYDRDKLGATFFFFRSDPARNDGNRLFPTLAWQLALSVPTMKDLIASSLEEYPDLPRKVIEIQFNKLITQSFLTLSRGGSAVPTFTRVVVIDGLDECSDEKLQERILKVIGNAVADSPFPLHFLISSRPEARSRDQFGELDVGIDQKSPVYVDDGFRDIQTYFTSEFARIAIEQGLDPMTWPTQGVIDTLVSKSSAQFVYASTVMKYIGDKYESAVAQLAVILGLKPSTGKSPFSELDALYTEILKRQPDRNFLKEFLSLLVARSMLSGASPKLHEDDPMLLDLDETQLYRKLRGMYSVLKFEPFIHVHHKSFLDFLDDSSRSGEYHISKYFANRRYMQRITDLLVTAASRAMKQLDTHEGGHFQPNFAHIIKSCAFRIELSVNDLEEILQPLHIIQEDLLQLPNMSIPWKPRACEECWTFYMIDNLLLHLAFLGETQLQELKYVGIRPLTAVEEKESIPQLDLDTCLSRLLASLNGVEPRLSLNVDMIGLMRALVRFDPIETAMKIRSITDAQNLVEFIFYKQEPMFQKLVRSSGSQCDAIGSCNLWEGATSPTISLPESIDLDRDKMTYQGKAVITWEWSNRRGYVGGESFSAFMWGSLSHDTMGPLLGISFMQFGMVEVLALPENAISVRKWRERNNPSVSTIQQIFFEVAKAIQYIHTLGIVFGYQFDEYDIYVDSNNHAKVLCPGFRPNDLCEAQLDYEGYNMYFSTLEYNIRFFALLFYQTLFNDWDYYSYIETHPNEPEIPNNVWQLIQWCYAEDPKESPTIDQVVQKMESWISLGQFTLSSR